MDDFTIHACEQVLRFTRAESWESLSEALKVQLAFNVGAVALSLKLTKAEGFQALADVREGRMSMRDFQNHMRMLITSHNIKVDDANITRPF